MIEARNLQEYPFAHIRRPKIWYVSKNTYFKVHDFSRFDSIVVCNSMTIQVGPFIKNK